jgi:hypothetical protein
VPGFEPFSKLLQTELTQRREEGCDVDGFASRVEAAVASGDAAQMGRVYDELAALPVKSDFPFDEPSDLIGIRARRRASPPPPPGEPTSDQFLGAWLGRCAGCALGKPLETEPFMAGALGNPGWKNVHAWFEQAGAWPIRDFTPGVSPFGRTLGLERLRCEASQRGNVRFMESDDDLRYTVLGLSMLETKGRRWTTWDMGKHWHNSLTYNQVCTAETQAYLNFAHVTCHEETWTGRVPGDWEEKIQWVRSYRNPYREWIGAQIRADGLAYGAAGNPGLAAELAWRDASLSHVKNGIYGEMFVAAMIAAAFVEKDLEKIVAIGLGEIPATSRLYRDIGEAMAIAKQCTAQLELVERIWEAFCHYNCVHTINNAALVVAALLFACDDFEQAITTAVLGGWDTDCNGATVGSIMGARLGAAALPQKWTTPFHDTLNAAIPGFHPIAISECAQRSEAVWRKLRD